MARTVDQSQQILLSRCKQLIKEFGHSSLHSVLRLFYKMVVFDSDFDTALIEFLKQATGNFIQAHKDLELERGATIKDLIEQTNKVSVSKYVQDIVLKNEEDPHTIVFSVAPLAMRIGLQLIEYPKPSEDNKSPYPAQTDTYSFLLPDPLNFHSETIRLLRSDRLLYDVLYTPHEIKSAPALLRYDSDPNIDTLATSDGAQILEPLCCKQGYYLPGYYWTMVKKRGGLSRRCVVCGQDLDELSYQKLRSFKKGWPYGMIIAAGLTLAAYAVSTLFAIDHTLFY